jgi:arogenate dehydrogenase (NADP+), plant
MDSSTNNDSTPQQQRGLEELKQMEANLKRQLDDIQFEKRFVLQSRPLNIGVVGFGRFGRFICSTFTKYGRVVATSRSDYSDIASSMGVKYVRLTNPGEFLSHDLDVIIFATSILSFESTIQSFVPHLEKDLQARRQRQCLQQRRRGVNGEGEDDDNGDREVIAGPLIVDVLSVKEHPRQILLQHLPKECDILCTRKCRADHL